MSRVADGALPCLSGCCRRPVAKIMRGSLTRPEAASKMRRVQHTVCASRRPDAEREAAVVYKKNCGLAALASSRGAADRP